MNSQDFNNEDQGLVLRLRAFTGITEDQMSDDDLMLSTEGMFFRAMIELRMAYEDLWDRTMTNYEKLS